MAEKTGISWTDSSWSPWIGCTKVSPGCDHCYAEALDKRHRYGSNEHWGPGVPRYRTKQWQVPLAWNRKAAASGKRHTVFPSLCDPFDNEVPEDWRSDLWRLIGETPALTWLLLTKRIGNAKNMLPPWLDNIWIGASVVNQEEADRDIPKLLATPAAKRFVSYEPALGPIDFSRWLRRSEPIHDHGAYAIPESPRIDWLIVGGESNQGGAKARPFDIDWARLTIGQCRDAMVPCFVKQLGSNPVYRTMKGYGNGMENLLFSNGERLKDRAGADPAEWPANLRTQEFPA